MADPSSTPPAMATAGALGGFEQQVSPDSAMPNSFVLRCEYSHEEYTPKPGKLNYKQFQRKLLSFTLDDMDEYKEHIEQLTRTYKDNWQEGTL